MLVQVRAPHFTAGIILENGKVVEAAPILRWTLGKTHEWLREYFIKKEWKAVQVKSKPPIQEQVL